MNNSTSFRLGAIPVVAALMVVNAPSQSTVAFHRLDALSVPVPGLVDVAGLSPDGTVVIGQSTGPAASQRATKWGGGIAVDIGLPPGTTQAFARAAALGGQTVVGDVTFATTLAHRWNGSGIQVLPNTFGGLTSYAWGVSWMGDVIVGQADGSPAMWTSAPGVQILGALPGAPSPARGACAGVDAGGSIAVGTSQTASGAYDATLWSQGAAIDLGVLPGDTQSSAAAISGNGQVIVGTSTVYGPWGPQVRAFHLDRTGSAGMQAIPLDDARCVNYDGSVVGGYIRQGSQYRAALWTPAGVVDLELHLQSLGVPIGNLRLTNVVGVSADGTAVCGQAYDPASPAYFLGYHVRNLTLDGIAVRNTACGDLFVQRSGRPAVGSTFGFSLIGGQGFQFFLGGLPANNPIAGCASCTIGVSGVSLPAQFTIQVPNHPSFVGVQFSFQGFDFGAGTCLGGLRATNTLDVTIHL